MMQDTTQETNPKYIKINAYLKEIYPDFFADLSGLIETVTLKNAVTAIVISGFCPLRHYYKNKLRYVQPFATASEIEKARALKFIELYYPEHYNRLKKNKDIVEVKRLIETVGSLAAIVYYAVVEFIVLNRRTGEKDGL